MHVPNLAKADLPQWESSIAHSLDFLNKQTWPLKGSYNISFELGISLHWKFPSIEIFPSFDLLMTIFLTLLATDQLAGFSSSLQASFTSTS